MEIKHGTRTGYNKCVARPEGSCEACKEAARLYEAERAARKAAENAESLADAMDVLPEPTGPFDELGEHHRMLRMVDALLYRVKSPRDTAPLLQRRMEIVSRIAELERVRAAASGERVSPLDEIAQRRAERLNRAAG